MSEDKYKCEVKDIVWRECKMFLGPVRKDLPSKDMLDKFFEKLEEQIRIDAKDRVVISIERHGPVALPIGMGESRAMEWVVAVSCRSVNMTDLEPSDET